LKVATIIDKQLSERFEVAFNQIHSWLRKSIKNVRTDKFSELLRIGFPQHSIIRKHYHDLQMFARLRNSIVHDKVKIGFYIAEPHEQVVDKIEKIATQVFQPKTALSIASTPVLYFQEETPLTDILNTINKTSYSIYPIYNQMGHSSLLTLDIIVKWLSDNLVGNFIRIENIKVSQLISLKAPPSVEFVNKDADMFAVEEIFEQYHLRSQKLEAVIITETGSPSEKPLGIITSWDLVEIDTLD
jgi:predicted transcriptional regulator